MKNTLATIKRESAELGSLFFDKGAVRFFNSRLIEHIHEGPGGTFFITSEQFDENTPRLYTVRKFDPSKGRGCVETVGEFQQYETSRAAHKAAGRLAQTL